MRRLLRLTSLFVVLAVLGLTGGCGKKSAAGVSSKYADTFKSAPEPVKNAWNLATEAMKTNGYAVAIGALGAAQSAPGITPEQTKALQETATAISDQMYEAANRDDPAAQQAIQDLRAMRGR